MKNLKTILFVFFCVGFVHAQSCDKIFEAIKVSDGIIISSKSNDTTSILSKINAQGEEIWHVESTNPSYLRYMKLELFSDNFLYVTVSLPSDYYTNSNYQVWKVNPSNGTIVWKSVVFTSEDDESPVLLDYKSDQLLFMYPINDGNGGSIGGFNVITLGRANAAVVPIYEFNSGLEFLNMTIDSKGNIIYATKNPIAFNNKALIRKISGINFKNVLWEKSYYATNSSTSAILTSVGKLYMDKLDDLYAFSGAENIDLFKINSSTGDEIWKINNIAYERSVRDLKVKDGNMFLSFQHIYVGSVYTAFEVTKINLETAAVLWTSNELHMTLVGTPVQFASGSNESVFSFDLDCNGDVYATGYYGDANYGPAAWGIMKINGENGSKINELTVTLNAAEMNRSSYGRNAFFFDEGPLFLGNLQYSNTEASVRTTVKTNSDLTTILSKTYACFIDSDSDSIADFDENPDGSGYIENDDTDGDGIPNYLDNDDDGDGTLTINEDANGDGNPLNDFSDPSNPTLADYLNPNILLGAESFTLQNFVVYPNPVENFVYFNQKSNQEIKRSSLFSTTGIILRDKKDASNSMDLSGLASGVYFLKIETLSGNEIFKIVKD